MRFPRLRAFVVALARPILAAGLLAAAAACAAPVGRGTPGGGVGARPARTAVAYRHSDVEARSPDVEVHERRVHVAFDQQGKGAVYSVTFAGPTGETVVPYVLDGVPTPQRDVDLPAPGRYQVSVDGTVPAKTSDPYKQVWGSIQARVTYR